MALTAPPSRWQSDDTGGPWIQGNPSRGPGSGRLHQPSNPQAAEVETVNNAWKHVKAVVVNDGKAADLYDLLASSGKDIIDPMPIGWPSLLRPVSSMMGKMPAMVLQRYNACQVVCFCGVFPSIRRAWASVDNSLFLWRFDKWNDVPLEYSNEEQAICAVELVRPRPGVFAEAIQQVLVVCTTTEVVLLGVCCTAGSSDDPLNELSVIPLPGYSISSDGVTMCATASTAEGRIFLGGGDGHLYEVVYNLAGGWRQRRCAKVDHSRGLSSYLYLPTIIPAMWQTPSPILEIVVDTHRHILYTRSQKSSIVVYDLGSSGKESGLKKVAELSDLPDKVLQSGAIGGDIFRGRSPADRAGANIVHLATIPPAESSRLHLVVVTADGRRVYLTTTPSHGAPAFPSLRPYGLKPVVARQAPPQPAVAAARGGATSSTGLSVGVALYNNSMLLLSEAAQEGRSKLLTTARDMTIPPVGSSVTHGATSGLREAVGELEMLVPGETCSIQPMEVEQPLLPAGQISPSDDLAAQVTSQPPRFVLVSTAGVLELEKRRPVDILQQMMEERSTSKMDQFFKSYGAPEVAAMCFSLVTSTEPNSNVVQQAKEALENPSLTGQAQMRTDLGADRRAPSSSFDMGQAVPVAEPEWSGAHKGLCNYVARLLQPVWEQPVVSTSYACSLLSVTLEAYEGRLLKLEGFLKDYQQRRRDRASNARGNISLGGEPSASGKGGFAEYPQASTQGYSGMPPSKRPRLEEAAKQEDQRVAWIRGLVMRAAESCFLLGILSRHHMARLSSRLDEATRRTLGKLKLRDLVCSSQGEAVAAQLISVLVTEHLTASGGVAADLAARLQSGCPSYFKEDDKTFYQASGLLQRAEATAQPAEKEELVNQAVQLMMKVPLACDLGRVVPQLANLRNFAGCVELPLKKADLLDPTSSAALPGPEGKAGREARYEQCYVHVMQVLKDLTRPGTNDTLSIADRSSARKILLQRAALAQEPYFQEVLYNTLIDLCAFSDLLDLDSPLLEKHLRANGGMPPSGILDGPIGPLEPSQVQHLGLLAKVYVRRGRHDLASQVWEVVAVRRGGLGDKAISLQEREDAFQNAVREAKADGDPQAVRELEVRAHILKLQMRLVQTLLAQSSALQEGSADQTSLLDSVSELQDEPKNLAVLFNDYAVPFRVWDVCLEIVAAANHNDPTYNRQLWDAYLTQTWDKKRAEMSDASEEAAAQACFQDCCAAVEHLGAQISGNETVFPAAHVCLRLELAALGNWPHTAPPTNDATRVSKAMLKACRGNTMAVLRVYDTLLSQRGGDEIAEQAHLPIVRLALLRSQLNLMTPLARQLLDRPGLGIMGQSAGFRREAGLLLQECQKYAAEAGRLQPATEAEEVARSFNSLAEELGRVSARR